jgi:phosphopantetheinyl transferase
MPLIYHNEINAATKIGVWHITEGEFFFAGKVSLLRNITHPHKRLQHLAGRHLLCVLFPEFPLSLIQIADTRKPFLADEAFHFSISHCGDYAAAIVSIQNRVGVDIEIPHPKVERIQHKFLTTAEQEILSKVKNEGHPEFSGLTMAWSIKEAMFKWQGIGEVDFKKHMQIIAVHNANNGFVADCIFEKQERFELQVHSILIGGNNLSWVLS